MGYNRRGIKETEMKITKDTSTASNLLDRNSCFSTVAGAVKDVVPDSVVDLKSPEVKTKTPHCSPIQRHFTLFCFYTYSSYMSKFAAFGTGWATTSLWGAEWVVGSCSIDSSTKSSQHKATTVYQDTGLKCQSKGRKALSAGLTGYAVGFCLR